MASVNSLADMAAAVVCISLDSYVVDVNRSYQASNSQNLETFVMLTFKEDVFLPPAVSDKLVYMLSRSRCLNNTSLSLFGSKYTQLR